ncbi:MAG: HAD-IIA family hydrolase [Pygmaiobacter sp.]
MHTLSRIKLFLIDMDGTFYLDSSPLPGALEFLAALREKKVPFAFLTNNSSKGRADYFAKFAAMGVQLSEEELLTSADATIDYLKMQPFGKDILLVGTESLAAQFEAAGYCTNAADPRAVVLGFDTTLTYQKLVALCNAVRQGLPYIATHPDFNCPVEGGFLPDIGGVIALVEACTSRRPDAVIGKPNRFIAEAVAQRFQVALPDICMIGDRLYTDIALGRCGVATALVYTGEATPADYAASDEVASFVFGGIGDMISEL